jgi:hypothetical protein
MVWSAWICAGLGACGQKVFPDQYDARTYDFAGLSQDLATPGPLVDAATPTTCLAKPAGLIGWWRGEQNATDAAGTHNGAWAGSSTYAAGEVGQAFSLVGGNYITTGITYSGDLTIDLWAAATDSNEGNYSSVVATANTLADNSFQIDLDATNAFRVQAGVDALHVPIGAATTNSLQHLAMTASGSTVTTYLNGAKVASQTYASTPFAITAFSIGISRTGAIWFDGLIDEVHVFSRALDATEIASIYATGHYGLCP